MIAQATVTKITYRAIAQRWTIYVFIVITAFLILLAVCLLVAVSITDRRLKLSAFPEVDAS